MSKEKEQKLKALNLVVDKLEKQYGKGTVMKLGDKKVIECPTPLCSVAGATMETSPSLDNSVSRAAKPGA